MARVVLGVGGSVAAYRACDLARELMRGGHEVRACLTDSAQQFVTPALFEALTGQPCLVSAFDEPERGKMAHIDWAKEADLLVVAPATGNLLAKLAHGVADDMLSTIALATRAPWVIAPAMNPAMFASEPVRTALGILESRAAAVVEPDFGVVACGDEGKGKFAPVERIVEVCSALLARKKLLAGQRVLITSGPTQEPIDQVRYLTNRSSGKMGAALARAAQLMGAEVVVVTGPASVPLPWGVRSVHVRTAEEMLAAALKEAAGVDWIVGAAAVADYRPATRHPGKLRRGTEPANLELVPNPDIVAALATANPGAWTVGFSAEPSDDLTEARAKLARKGLKALAVNDISRTDAGFESDTNEVSLLLASGEMHNSGVVSKLACALFLFEKLVVARG